MSVITTPRTDRPGWAIAKSVGDTAERLVADLLTNLGLVVNNVNQPGHDLEGAANFEIKNDRLAVQTGNIAIEVEYKGRPSGLSTTTAHIWCILVGPRVIMLSADALRGLIVGRSAVNAGENARVILLQIVEVERAGIVLPLGKGGAA